MTGPLLPCPRCGAGNAAGLRFCEQCGAALAASGSRPAATAPSRGRSPVLLIGGVVAVLAVLAGVALVIFQSTGGDVGGGQAAVTATATATATAPPTTVLATTVVRAASTPTAAVPTATPATTAPTRTVAPTPTSPPPTPAATPLPTAPATAVPAPLRLPTDPARQIPVPTGIDAATRAVIDALNANGAAYAAAVRGPSVEPLRAVFTGAALQYYTGTVARLQAAGQYEVADLLTISLTDLRFEDAGHAVATTVEVWQITVLRAGSNQVVSGSQTTYAETYRLTLLDGRWLISENPFTTLSSTPR